ncbi:exodeoxyribonuclease VII large subunit [Candidatus Weimeria sp. HCP3S3_B5]|uniref:exodeoxyribonuclease VII large subunit n=1 Tax=Candidatus Weimeria sp. HCP3S3_B5 TaxID=3438871 RepID=UPI003F8A33C2
MNRVWTVAKLNNYISGLIEDDPAFAPQIVVEGNVSLGPKGYSRFSHIYFTLIDPDDPAPDYQKAKLSCAMWKSTVERGGLTYEMKNGDNIRVTGRIAVYGARSQYQLIATRIENAGAGKLEEAKRALFNELRARGYFEADHKKPIPAYITRVGIVTSPTGEAVHDIIRNIQLRNPHVEIYLVPALVQGDEAARSIAEALYIIDRLGMDVIICGRGGGSPEDLMAFSSIEVAQAIYDCETPVISAVGHEPDMSISDYVADLRVATPTAAAMQIFDYRSFCEDLDRRRDELKGRINHRIMEAELHLRRVKEQVDKGAPDLFLARMEKELIRLRKTIEYSISDKLKDRETVMSGYGPFLKNALDLKLGSVTGALSLAAASLPQAMGKKLENRTNTLRLAAQKIEYSSPLKKLSDGYAYVEGDKGRITSVSQVKRDDQIRLTLSDGMIESRVDKIKEKDIAGKEE